MCLEARLCALVCSQTTLQCYCNEQYLYRNVIRPCTTCMQSDQNATASAIWIQTDPNQSLGTVLRFSKPISVGSDNNLSEKPKHLSHCSNWFSSDKNPLRETQHWSPLWEKQFLSNSCRFMTQQSVCVRVRVCGCVCGVCVVCVSVCACGV